MPTEVVSELLFHYAWPWLSNECVIHLCQACPVMSSYAGLRSEALSLSPDALLSIRAPLPYDLPDPTICLERSRNIAKILLLCDFNFGLFQRFMGGTYTGDYLDFDAIDAAILELSTVPSSPDLPSQDFVRVKHILHHGFPMAKHFRSSRSDCIQRNLYNNHSTIVGYESILRQKLAGDIQNSFACAFPRWFLYFMNGLTLNAMGIAIRTVSGKVKHRLINDPSTPVLGPSDTGNLNAQLDKKNRDDVPKVFYGSANRRLWTRIYNLRIQNPCTDIILYKDDIVAAFRRGKYHPDIAVAYGYVFESFLVIPLGGLFGPRDTPGWFCMTSELRAFASSNLSSFTNASHALASQIQFTDSGPTEPLTPALADSFNQGIVSSPGPQTVFVDDTLIAELRCFIRQSAASSFLSAALFYGTPPQVAHPISCEKYMAFFGHYTNSLGLDVDCRRLLVIFPLDKRQDLRFILLSFTWKKGLLIRVRILAGILGKIRHAGQILPLGEFLSFFLQENLNDHIKSKATAKLAWFKHSRIHINAATAHALLLLQELLSRDVPNVWERPIGLLIPRDPSFKTYSDACLKGLGGYCHVLNFQWRQQALHYSISNSSTCVDPSSDEDPHINIFEFIALIITIFFAIIRMNNPSIRSRFLTPSGYILHAMADNTSALSWMRHASRSRAPPTRNLAQFLVTLLFHANSLFPISSHGFHVPGSLNDFADALSRFQKYPSYEDVWSRYAALRPLQAYQVPHKLTAMLNSCLSQNLMPAPSAQEMNLLLQTKLHSFRYSVRP